MSWKAPDAQGWIEELDASSGRTYFCNAELGRTQWDDPRAIGHSGESHVVAAAEAKEVLWAGGTSLFHHAIDRPAERAPRHTFKAAATAVRATRRMSMLGTSRVEAQRQADALAAVEAVPVVLALASDGSLLPNGWKEGTTGTGLVYVIRFVLSWYNSLLIMCIHICSLLLHSCQVLLLRRDEPVAVDTAWHCAADEITRIAYSAGAAAAAPRDLRRS